MLAVAADIEEARKLAASAVARVRRLHLTYVGAFLVLVVVGTCGASKLSHYYEGREAKLAARASTLEGNALAARKAADIWRTQALALVDQWRVDTLHTNTVIHDARTTSVVSVPIAISQPDGTTSEIPMPMVHLEAFNGVVAACTEERHTCASALAAKDSAQAALRRALVFADSLYTNSEDQRRAEQHATTWAKVKAGGVGFLGGTVVGAVGAALVCRR